MTTIGDKFTALGTSIINLVGTRASRNMDNLSTVGRENIIEIAGGSSGGASRNIGEIIQSTLPLTDAGLHLLDGTLINGSGIYAEFVDYIAELYENTQVSGYELNVTKTGSLADNDGVLSGFSANSYASLPSAFNPGNSSWEQQWKFTTGSSLTSTYQRITGTVTDKNGGVNLVIKGSALQCWMTSTVGTWDIWAGDDAGGTSSNILNTNTTYWVKMSYDGVNTYKLSYSTDGITFTDLITKTSNKTVSSTQVTTVGYGSNNYPFNGSVDLKECYININGQRWWTGAEAIKPCFCTETQWQNSVTTYGSCGKFVYDSTLNTVRLPKVSDILQGTTDLTALGNLIEAGLPAMTALTSGGHNHALNITTSSCGADPGDTYPHRWSNGDHAWVGTSNPVTSWNGDHTHTVNTGVRATSTVQPQTIKILLYIVIAISTKTDIQVDIDEIATDLNGKADVDLSNISASQNAKNEIISWENPDWTNRISMPLPAQPVSSTTATYTCPSDGYILIDADKSTSGNTLFVFINSITVASVAAWQPSNANLFYRVCKGDVIKITADNTSASWYVGTKLFIPMKGAE